VRRVRDPVPVAKFVDGGLVFHVRADGTLMRSLKTPLVVHGSFASSAPTIDGLLRKVRVW
jgi:hypothetical protein